MLRVNKCISILLFFIVFVCCLGCKGKSSEEKEVVSLGWDVDTTPYPFAKSEVSLPYEGNVSAYNFRVDTLKKGELLNTEKYFSDSDYLTYITFPSKDDITLMYVPIKDAGYKNAYRLFTVKGREVVSDILAEGEWIDKDNSHNNSLASLTIDEVFTIHQTKAENKDNVRSFDYKKYSVSESGALEEISVDEKAENNPCLAKEYPVRYPLKSEMLENVNFAFLNCSNIEGIQDYACYDGINYITLKSKGAGMYYILVDSECGDFVFTDLLVIKNNKVVAGLTVDSSVYDAEDEDAYSEEKTFEMNANLEVKLKEQKISRGEVLSTVETVYMVTDDGRIVKKK